MNHVSVGLYVCDTTYDRLARLHLKHGCLILIGNRFARVDYRLDQIMIRKTSPGSGQVGTDDPPLPFDAMTLVTLTYYKHLLSVFQIALGQLFVSNRQNIFHRPVLYDIACGEIGAGVFGFDRLGD